MPRPHEEPASGDAARPGGPSRPATAEEVQQTPEFAALRRSFRRFIFPMTALFLSWYALYVLLAAFAPGFMSQRLGGSTITVGLVFGLGQFVSTFAITMIYRSWADKKFDPEAERLRERIEGAAV